MEPCPNYVSLQMKPWTKVAAGIFATMGLLYVGLVAVASFLAEKACTVYPVMKVTSPNGKWKAEQTQEVCNDDNKTFTAVWVSDNRSVNLGGHKFSAFRAASSQPPNVSQNAESLDLQLVWINDSTLQIGYPHGIELQHKEGTKEGVFIKYLELSSGTGKPGG